MTDAERIAKLEEQVAELKDATEAIAIYIADGNRIAIKRLMDFARRALRSYPFEGRLP